MDGNLQVCLSEGEADVLALFLEAIQDYLAPVLKDVKEQQQKDNHTDVAANIELHRKAYQPVLPKDLVRHGFHDVKRRLGPKGVGIPEWAVRLLRWEHEQEKENADLSCSVEIQQAYLVYIAEELLELKDQTRNISSCEQDIVLTAERLDLVLQSDEEFRQLRWQIGFCVSAEAGVSRAHVHRPCQAVRPHIDDQTRRLLEAVCSNGTAPDALALLARCGYLPFENPLRKGCSAMSRALPTVPSRVAPPSFERASGNSAGEEEESGCAIKEERATSMLLVCCHFGNLEVAQLLVQRFGADVSWGCDVETKDQYSPLYAAVAAQHATLTQMLLEHGAKASIEVRELRGEWHVQRLHLLELAIRKQVALSIVTLLLEHGALEGLDASRRTDRTAAVEWAATEGRVDVLQVLVEEYGVAADVEPPEASEGEGEDSEHLRVYTPLMAAVSNERGGPGGAVEYLLAQSANPNLLYPSVVAATQYHTPLRMAAMRGDAESVRALRRHGAAWSAHRNCFTWGRGRTGEGQVELQDAIVGHGTRDEQRVAAVRGLLEEGAKCNEFLMALAGGVCEQEPRQWREIAPDARVQIARLVLEASAVDPVGGA